MSFVSDIVGGLIGADSDRHAANQQRDAAAESNATQRYFYDTSRADYAPYRQAGYGALDQINALLGINAPRQNAFSSPAANPGTDPNALRSQLLPQYTSQRWVDGTQGQGDNVGTYFGGHQDTSVDEAGLQAAIQARMAQQGTANTQPVQQYNPGNALNALQNTPGYQFGLSQGQAAIDRSAASRGGLYSGATLKALQRYGQDYGSTKLGEQFNRLASVAGLGQTATSGTANAGMNAGNQIGQTQASLGNALAANTLNGANRWGNVASSIGAYGNRNGWFSGGSSGPSNSDLESMNGFGG
jgi:hypothetical protein